MPRILRNSRAETVRSAANHSIMQWERFSTISYEEARGLLRDSPTMNWRAVPASDKEIIMVRVNSRLADEGIPQVAEDVFLWRMSMAVRAAKNAANREAAVLNTNTAARPFDPVRD
ncbi:hypothetical protein M011DRAFT_434326 [Sporormia fimetaria CBS 119925]|uniref:Uncharacterized protein n=1 Tax=Sporormia fimetaria CBS 119925 TaxID=1340428 RepID=A0A6A6UW42_9PLEO|nr:hypothetical protein M011DRAFT_434326 [Sporormia fimetaria CBS 119925]